MVCVAWFFSMQISATGLSPCLEPPRSISSRLRRRHLLRHVGELVADHLCSPIGLPKALRSRA